MPDPLILVTIPPLLVGTKCTPIAHRIRSGLSDPNTPQLLPPDAGPEPSSEEPPSYLEMHAMPTAPTSHLSPGQGEFSADMMTPEPMLPPAPSPVSGPRTCNNCGSPDHMLKDCPHELLCTNCGRKGHTHHVCKSRGMPRPWVGHGKGEGLQCCCLGPRRPLVHIPGLGQPTVMLQVRGAGSQWFPNPQHYSIATTTTSNHSDYHNHSTHYHSQDRNHNHSTNGISITTAAHSASQPPAGWSWWGPIA